MNRRDFVRNTLMAFAVSLVPKILQPSIPEAPKLIASYMAISRQMLKNLPFLQSWLPGQLMKELSRQEFFDPTKPIDIEIVENDYNYFASNITIAIGKQLI